MKILIIGAGPCGLGAAYHLDRLGYANWQLFEQHNHVGGLSASFMDDAGFTWDIGGHVLFSHYKYFDRAVSEALHGNYYEHQRESWIRVLNHWVPYPFQNNVRHLPEYALRECLEGLRSLPGTSGAAENFLEWMNEVFGSGIVKYFMEPYNRKVWGVPLDVMSKEWIAERVSVVDLARIERNISQQRDDLGWGPNNVFKFPKYGGTGAIYEGIAKPLLEKISFRHALESIDIERKRVHFSNGRTEPYDIIINTSPLDLLVSNCMALPDSVKNAASELVHNSGLVAGIGFEAHRDDTKCWMYFPEADSPFYRVTNFHNYSRNNVPGGATDRYFSLMCETTYTEHKPEDRTRILDATIKGLLNCGLIDDGMQERVASRYLIDIPYSYPVPTLGRDRALATIQPYLESRSIFSRGRFGSWKYEVGNMDHSFMQGVEIVDRLLSGKEELTVNGRAG